MIRSDLCEYSDDLLAAANERTEKMLRLKMTLHLGHSH